MGRHKIPAIANRLRLNRGFDSAWYASPADYARVLQRDWLITKNAWSFVQRCSRSNPKVAKDQSAEAAAASKLDPTRPRYPAKPQPQQQDARDFPNFRPARIFTQHMPYKSSVSIFAYTAPREGPQAKYGLFQGDTPKQRAPPPGGRVQDQRGERSGGRSKGGVQ